MNQKPVISTGEQDLPIVGEVFVCVYALSLCLHLIWVCLQDFPYSLKLLLILSETRRDIKISLQEPIFLASGKVTRHQVQSLPSDVPHREHS